MSRKVWYLIFLIILLAGVCFFLYFRQNTFHTFADVSEGVPFSTIEQAAISAADSFFEEIPDVYAGMSPSQAVMDNSPVLSNETESAPEPVIEDSFRYPWLETEHLLIAHALGEYMHCAGSNSREALEYNYEKGFRVFECDFLFLGDQAALLHDEKSGSRFTGLKSGFQYEDYMGATILGRCSPLSVEALFQFMAQHPDMYLITDSKYDADPQCSKMISEIVDIAKGVDESVLDRVIVQIYNNEMLDTVLGVYPFRSVIYTMYQTDLSAREVAEFCRENGIQAVTFSYQRIQECLNVMKEYGVVSLIHTVNKPKDAADYFERGVYGIYTDSLTPEA